MAITNRNQLIREVYQLLNKEGFELSLDALSPEECAQLIFDALKH